MIIKRYSKGAPLTHSEMDANWDAVAEKVDTVLASTLKVNTDALVINSNKRVSIGSSDDSGGSSLMVVGTSGVSYTGTEMNTNPASLYISNPQTTVADAGAHLILTAAGITGAAGAARVSTVRTGDGSGALTFGTRNASIMTEKMRVTANGNVLIGTATDVASKLYAYQPTGPVASFRSDGPDTVRCWRWVNFYGAAAGRLMFGALNASSTQVDYASLGGLIMSATAGSHTGAMTFYTVNAGVNDERMRITGQGNILIATNLDDNVNKLQVNGGIVFKPMASAAPAQNGELTFEATSNTTVKVKLKGSDGVVRAVTLTLA